MKLSEMCEAERPREKMLARGAGALGNGELLAVLLRTGTRSCNVVELAQRLLASCDGSLTKLFNFDIGNITVIPGIGPDKAATVLAAFELGRRFLQEKSLVPKESIVSARMVYDIMLPRMKGLLHEECWALFLSGANCLISLDRINIGDAGSTVVDTSRIVRMAIEKSARGIILVHNHPSSNPHPSDADIRQTSVLRDMASSCGVNLLDHIIISDDSYFSFADDR